MTKGIASESKRIESNPNEDRISNLPDVLLFLILSYLPSENAVVTSTLSKRWRFIWHNITSFKFGGEYHSNTTRLPQFVDRVLKVCTAKPIQRFSLNIKRTEFDIVKAWVDEAIARNVCELELSLSKFPSCVFTCKTLTLLKILFCGKGTEYEIPPSAHLPSVKVLEILGFYPPNELMEKLFIGCPVLEDLRLSTNCHEKDFTINISSPSLKKLKLDLHSKNTSNGKIVIDAPNLKYMYMYHAYMADCELEFLSSMERANVDVGRYLWGGFDDETIPNRAIQLLKGLSAVKSLTLGYGTMKVLDRAYQHHLPMFYKLTWLELINYEEDGRKILPRLLEVSPKLRILILDKGCTSLGLENTEDESGVSDWKEPQSVPDCLSKFLEVVKIRGFKGNEYELKLVEYLLVHAECLKTLSIRFANVAPETVIKVRKKLMDFPKISSSCEIHFFNDH